MRTRSLVVFDLTYGSGLGTALGFVTAIPQRDLGHTVYREMPGPSKANCPGPPLRCMNVKPSETAGDAERAHKAVAMARGKDTSLAGMRRREIDRSDKGESLAAFLTPCSAVRYTVRAPDRLSHVVLDEQHDRSIDHARSPPMKPSANAVTRAIPRGWRRRSRCLINGHRPYVKNSCAGIDISSTRRHLRNSE